MNEAGKALKKTTNKVSSKIKHTFNKLKKMGRRSRRRHSNEVNRKAHEIANPTKIALDDTGKAITHAVEKVGNKA
ncbi:hypothetical protein V3C99_014662 [Haemonchus contortus]|nr:unnamed protein product [Haemonchus contortus]